MRPLLVALVLWLACWPAVAEAPPSLSAPAESLLSRLESMDVLHHWLPGHERIDWESGDPLPGKPGSKRHTHCSAFVSAACQRLGVPILSPPEHSPHLLANAQQDWLNSDQGRRAGWTLVENAEQARQRANQGQLVVASCKNPDPHKPGHIAIVRPSLWSPERIAREGCEIIQAGGTNYVSASLKKGFHNHPGAFEQGQIQFHAHPLP